jgi:peptidyl-prolyl cis-trans isomerase C
VNAARGLRFGAAVALLLLLTGGVAATVAGAAKAPKAGPAKRGKSVTAVATTDTSPVFVRIGDETITAEDVRMRMEDIPEASREAFATPEGRQRLLERIVEERVWLLTALRAGVADRPQVRRQLELQRRDLLIRTYLNEAMTANAAPSDSEVRGYYDAHVADFRTPATVTARHIQTATEAQARQVLKLARSGQDWAKLVTRFSTDTLTRVSAGLLGTVTRDGSFAALGRQPALAESVFTLGVGRIGGPYRTERGWHVVRVDESRPEGTRPLEAVRPAIMRQLGNQRSQDFYRQLFDEARRSLGVTSDSAAIQKFVAQKREPREMFKAAQAITAPQQRIAAYRQLLADYPDSDVSAQAQFMIGFVNSEELKDYDAAEKAFRELLVRYPKSELTDSARWMVEHMRTEEAPPFDMFEADSSRQTPPPGAAEGSTGKR